VDDGSGDTLLLLHGNPAWSFLYRKIIAGLKDDYRCIPPDFPGYGMSTAPSGHSFTPREHSEMLERFVDRLHLSDLTIMVQDWGRPDRARIGGSGARNWCAFSRGFARPIDPGVLELYLAPWSDRRRRAPAVIAPRQLVAATPNTPGGD
jgi:pimeloyl-ACP methyl ester carboxylesterase